MLLLSQDKRTKRLFVILFSILSILDRRQWCAIGVLLAIIFVVILLFIILWSPLAALINCTTTTPGPCPFPCIALTRVTDVRCCGKLTHLSVHLCVVALEVTTCPSLYHCSWILRLLMGLCNGPALSWFELTTWTWLNNSNGSLLTSSGIREELRFMSGVLLYFFCKFFFLEFLCILSNDSILNYYPVTCYI